MKIAVNVKQTLTRTLVVEAEDYDKAVQKVQSAYKKGDVCLTEDNSISEFEYNDETDTYKELFGEEAFDEMEVEKLEETEEDVDDDYPCNNCEMKDGCDGWEARYCCTLCHYLGDEDCDNCDPMDI